MTPRVWNEELVGWSFLTFFLKQFFLSDSPYWFTWVLITFELFFSFEMYFSFLFRLYFFKLYCSLYTYLFFQQLSFKIWWFYDFSVYTLLYVLAQTKREREHQHWRLFIDKISSVLFSTGCLMRYVDLFDQFIFF